MIRVFAPPPLFYLRRISLNEGKGIANTPAIVRERYLGEGRLPLTAFKNSKVSGDKNVCLFFIIIAPYFLNLGDTK